MGRHPRNSEEDLEDDGEAKKLPGEKECKEAIDKLVKFDEKKANLASDIKSLYDGWANKGFDRDDLKAAYKEYKKRRSDDSKSGINHILNKIGQGDLFVHAGIPRAEAA